MSGYDSLFSTADQFIALANELARKDSSGTVGAALRYAAARYNAFEASVAGNLRAEKDKVLQDFTNDYRQMLDFNLDDHIARG